MEALLCICWNSICWDNSLPTASFALPADQGPKPSSAHQLQLTTSVPLPAVQSLKYDKAVYRSAGSLLMFALTCPTYGLLFCMTLLTEVIPCLQARAPPLCITLLTCGILALQTRALLYMTALSNSLLEAVATAEDAVTQVIALHHGASPSPEPARPDAKQAGAATEFASSQLPPADQPGAGGLSPVCSTSVMLLHQKVVC